MKTAATCCAGKKKKEKGNSRRRRGEQTGRGSSDDDVLDDVVCASAMSIAPIIDDRNENYINKRVGFLFSFLFRFQLASSGGVGGGPLSALLIGRPVRP